MINNVKAGIFTQFRVTFKESVSACYGSEEPFKHLFVPSVEEQAGAITVNNVW